MINEEINILPNAICNVMLNDEYRKIASETIILEDNTDAASFDFIVEYPKDNYVAFLLKVVFKEDQDKPRMAYNLEENTGAIVLVGYNIDRYMLPENNCTTVFCGMKKIIDIEDKRFCIKPRVNIYYNGIKEVIIDLYAK